MCNSKPAVVAFVILAIVIVVIVVVVVPSVVIPMQNNKGPTRSRKELSVPDSPLKNSSMGNSTITSEPVTLNLTVSELVSKWKNSTKWNIVDVTYGFKLISVQNNTLKVTYPKNSYSPSGNIRGGFQFYASPKVFPASRVRFDYKVFFPRNFNWVKGGMLPGVWMGRIGAHGGQNIPDGASFRLMWRAGGQLEAYVYMPMNETAEFVNATRRIRNQNFGRSLWRGVASITTDQWTNISIIANMNSKTGVADGVIGLIVNNITMMYNKVNWGNGPFQIQGLMMHTYFGGLDASWATPITQHVYFKDFSATTS